MGKFINLIGKKFEKLLVIRREIDYICPSGQRKIMWLCKCDCGNKTIVASQELKNGDTKSCGCIKRKSPSNYINLIGKRFGRLMVIERVADYIEPSGRKRIQWLCLCDCGIKKIINGDNLKSGSICSCGCLKKEWEQGNARAINKNKLFNEYKGRAKQKGLPFILSKERFFGVISEECYYCGSEPLNGFYNGIDRIDSKIGYIEKNIVPCCWKCNQAKNKTDVNDFYKWVDKIYEYQHRNN
jgi:hypothetical protein